MPDTGSAEPCSAEALPGVETCRSGVSREAGTLPDRNIASAGGNISFAAYAAPAWSYRGRPLPSMARHYIWAIGKAPAEHGSALHLGYREGPLPSMARHYIWAIGKAPAEHGSALHLGYRESPCRAWLGTTFGLSGKAPAEHGSALHLGYREGPCRAWLGTTVRSRPSGDD